jgi:hypothetical protein
MGKGGGEYTDTTKRERVRENILILRAKVLILMLLKRTRERAGIQAHCRQQRTSNG